MLYIVALTLNAGVDVTRVQAAMKPAHSWYRIAPTAWIICTEEQAAVWSQRLSPFVRPDGSVFVSRLDPSDFQGWMTTEFWNWFNQHKDAYG